MNNIKGLRSFIQSTFEKRTNQNNSLKQAKKIRSQSYGQTNLILSRRDIHKLELKAVRRYQVYAVKNMLVFSFHSGLQLEEILKLKKSNIKVLPDGSKVLEIKRIGGIPNSLIPVDGLMESIIHYYNGYHKNARRGKLFPTYSNDEINESLTYLSAYTGIYKPLTFLLARRTYLIQEILNGTSVETLQINLGHKEIKSTRSYIKHLMRESFGATNFSSLYVKSTNNEN